MNKVCLQVFGIGLHSAKKKGQPLRTILTRKVNERQIQGTLKFYVTTGINALPFQKLKLLINKTVNRLKMKFEIFIIIAVKW